MVENFSHSPLCERYLSSLDKEAAPTAADLRQILESRSFEPFEPWIEFQDRYAGYVERYGNDLLVWGITHFEDEYYGPLSVRVTNEEGRYFARCMRGHPSYQFWLRDDGDFDDCASRFQVHVERLALIWDVARSEGVRRFSSSGEVEASGLLARMQGAMSADQVVSCASDDYRTFYRGQGWLIDYSATAAGLEAAWFYGR